VNIAVTWLRFGGWLLLGAVLYALYGYRHSHLRRGGGGGSGRFERDPGDKPAPTAAR
jgi:hypothetical protein